jgi:DNA-binding NarL/FixJ family response regulator
MTMFVDTKTIRVALLHPMLAWLDALEVLLEPRPDIEVVGAHTAADWVRHAVAANQADVLLLHVDHASVDGPAEIRANRDQRPDLGVVAISDSADTSLVTSCVRAGARGWVSQATSFEHLLRVIHGVSRGETWIPPRLVSGLLDSLLSAEETRQQESEVLALLSARETEVLNCLAQGLTRQEIAQRYFLSPHTVRTHINNVLRKLDVHSTLAAVSIARRIGLPNPDFD